jgi:hypothetical protein
MRGNNPWLFAVFKISRWRNPEKRFRLHRLRADLAQASRQVGTAFLIFLKPRQMAARIGPLVSAIVRHPPIS